MTLCTVSCTSLASSPVNSSQLDWRTTWNVLKQPLLINSTLASIVLILTLDKRINIFQFCHFLVGKLQSNSAFSWLPFLFLLIWLYLFSSSSSFLNPGGFLSDAGWYGDAEKVFLSCLQLCTLHSEVLHCFRAVECCVRSVCDSRPLASHFFCWASQWQHHIQTFVTCRDQSISLFSCACHVGGGVRASADDAPCRTLSLSSAGCFTSETATASTTWGRRPSNSPSRTWTS